VGNLLIDQVSDMKRQHPHNKPDFFAVVVLLVMIGFGLTLAVQVAAIDRNQVVHSEVSRTGAG
jgi:PHP family Zn ribbon phosphoesterase